MKVTEKKGGGDNLKHETWCHVTWNPLMTAGLQHGLICLQLQKVKLSTVPTTTLCFRHCSECWKPNHQRLHCSQNFTSHWKWNMIEIMMRTKQILGWHCNLIERHIYFLILKHTVSHVSHPLFRRICQFPLCIHQLKGTNDSRSPLQTKLRLLGTLRTLARWLAVAQVDFKGDNLFLLVLKRDSSSKVNHSSAALSPSSPGPPPALTSPLLQLYLYRLPPVSSRLLCSSFFVSFILLPWLSTVSQGLRSFISLCWVNYVVKPLDQRYALGYQSKFAELLPNIYIINYFTVTFQ